MAETALFLGTKLMSQTVKFKTKTIAEASNLLQSRRTWRVLQTLPFSLTISV